MHSHPKSPDPDGSQADRHGPSPPPPAGETWPETDHPTLRALRTGSAGEQEAALHKLFSSYAQPLRRYIRHHWPLLTETDIDDLVSEFLTLCLTGEKAHFLTFDPARPGPPPRLRTYLRSILDNFLRNHRRHSHAKIRGGDRKFESLDTIRPARHQETPAGGPNSPHHLDTETYDRHWAQHVLSLSFSTLENGTPAIRTWLPILRPWILADPGETSLKEIARQHGCTHDSVRTHLHRLRKALRKAVRDAVSQTVVDPAEIDDELRHLVAVLSRYPVE
jgi:RNA polymerase sigma factor (sigma-70 family)